MIKVDVRGFSCPIPVVRTKQAIEKNRGEEIEVLVETAVSRENVSRLAENRGYSVKAAAAGSDFLLTLTPPAD